MEILFTIKQKNLLLLFLLLGLFIQICFCKNIIKKEENGLNLNDDHKKKYDDNAAQKLWKLFEIEKSKNKKNNDAKNVKTKKKKDQLLEDNKNYNNKKEIIGDELKNNKEKTILKNELTVFSNNTLKNNFTNMIDMTEKKEINNSTIFNEEIIKTKEYTLSSECWNWQNILVFFAIG